MLSKGVYKTKRIKSEKWINESLKQSQKFTPIWGLLWWRLPEFEKRIIDNEIWSSWEQAGVETSFLAMMKPLKGKLYETKNNFFKDLEKVLGKEWNQILNLKLPSTVKSSNRICGNNIVAYYADWYRGNYLVIVPEKKLLLYIVQTMTDLMMRKIFFLTL